MAILNDEEMAQTKNKEKLQKLFEQYCDNIKGYTDPDADTLNLLDTCIQYFKNEQIELMKDYYKFKNIGYIEYAIWLKQMREHQEKLIPVLEKMYEYEFDRALDIDQG